MVTHRHNHRRLRWWLARSWKRAVALIDYDKHSADRLDEATGTSYVLPSLETSLGYVLVTAWEEPGSCSIRRLHSQPCSSAAGGGLKMGMAVEEEERVGGLVTQVGHITWHTFVVCTCHGTRSRHCPGSGSARAACLLLLHSTTCLHTNIPHRWTRSRGFSRSRRPCRSPPPSVRRPTHDFFFSPMHFG